MINNCSIDGIVPPAKIEEPVGSTTSSIVMPEILTALDLAALFHVSLSGAYNLLNSPEFPTLHVGCRKMVVRDDLLEWMKRNTNKLAV